MADNYRVASPGNPLGIVPQRMLTITWREARQDDKSYAITDIDPMTGEQRYSYLRWDDARCTEQGAGIKSETPDGAPLIFIAQVPSEAAVLGIWHDRCHAKNASIPSSNESIWSQAA